MRRQLSELVQFVDRLVEKRPGLEQMMAAVEEVKGEMGSHRDRHGDRGRDLVLYLGQRVCGIVGGIGQSRGITELCGGSDECKSL